MNSHHIERFYDLDTPIKDSISIAFLSDKLIHSYIFSLKFNESGEVTAFLFTSDDSKEECIYEMQIENFANLLQWIGYSDVINCHQVRDSKQPSGFKIKREYCFDDRIPRKGLPQKIKINYLSSYIETCLEAKSRSNLLPET